MHLIATLAVFAAEVGGKAAEGGKAPNPILPAKNEIIWGFLSFIVLFVLMAKLAFPPIRRMLKDREDRIRASLEGAESSKADADNLLDEYRQKLAEARSEAGTIIEEARRTAESMRRDLLAKAESESNELVDRARQQIESERVAAVDAVRREAASFSVELAERIVRQTIDRDAQARLIEQYIEELERMGRATS